MTRLLRIGLYLRISDDREGLALGVARQEADGRALIDSRPDWVLAGIYCDNDVSAYSGKKRKDYERMLQDVRDGELDGIAAQHPDRLHRAPRELEDFIDLVEQYHLVIGTVQAGDWDLTTPSGRAVARTLGAWARYESEHKGERVRRKLKQLRADGKISNGGARPFGYDRVFDREEKPRKIVEERLHPVEAPIVAEMAERALDLESLHSLVHDLRERGIKNTLGKDFERMTLKRMLTSLRIAGLREVEGELAVAPWPAIITPAQHERLVALYPYERKPGGGRKPRKWASSGLVYCTCGARMQSNSGTSGGKRKKAPPGFACPTPRQGGCGKRAVSTKYLEGPDGLLKALFLQHLEELTAAPPNDGTAALEAQIARWEERLAELETELLDGAGSVRSLRKAMEELEQRILDARSQISLTGVRRDVSVNVAELRESWDELPLERRASLYRAYIERIVILPKGRGGNRFDPARVVVEWR